MSSTIPRRWLRPTLQILAASALLGLVGAGASFRRYVQESPAFCRTCHEIAPEVEVWARAQHRDLRCQSCHHTTLRDGLRVLSLYITRGGSGDGVATHAPVAIESCAGCHASHDDRWPSIANSVGHTRHLASGDIPCTQCHGKEMHFDRPARSTCLSCHPQAEGTGAHDASHCLACHDFLGTEEAIRPTRASCLACHERQERPVVIATAAPMQFLCAACHRPHARTKGENLVPCSECHAKRDLVGLHTLPSHRPCSACHQAHDWSATRAACRRCHEGMESHHPEDRCVHCHVFSRGAGSIR